MALTTEKTAVLAPMPTASETIAATDTSGAAQSARIATRRSSISLSGPISSLVAGDLDLVTAPNRCLYRASARRLHLTGAGRGRGGSSLGHQRHSVKREHHQAAGDNRQQDPDVTIGFH